MGERLAPSAATWRASVTVGATALRSDRKALRAFGRVGPPRPGRPPASSAGYKTKYLSVSRPWHARAGVAPVALLRLPRPALSSRGSREKLPDGRL